MFVTTIDNKLSILYNGPLVGLLIMAESLHRVAWGYLQCSTDKGVAGQHEVNAVQPLPQNDTFKF